MPLTLERVPEILELENARAAGYTHYPVVMESLEDIYTPVGLYMKLRKLGSDSFLLESAEGGEKIGRYSFMGVNPFANFTVTAGNVFIDGRKLEGVSSPIAELKSFFSKFKVFPARNLPRLSGGAVGYFGYDFVRYVEDIPLRESADPVPDVLLNFYDTIIAVDNLKRRINLVTLLPLTGHSRDFAQVLHERLQNLNKITEMIGSHDASALQAKCSAGIPKFNMTQDRFEAMVARAKEYIIEGDIFQVVLSQRAEFDVEGDPFQLYRGVRALNPSPYMFYLEFGAARERLAVIGSSPEMFVRKEGKRVEMRPIAGTSPRGITPEEDDTLSRRLLDDEKEKAEHVMLVDLGRNDIGRVASTGTVHVENFMHIEKFSHVMHIVSDVIGTTEEGKDAIETLAACFPAGTLSGAPKVRAMEIISELEETPRKIYGGAVGYMDFNNNMDTCIAIRTFVVQGNTAYLQAGAGIVYDSNPEREFHESINKMRANLEALKLLGKF
jgi:anthranilate synthase component I